MLLMLIQGNNYFLLICNNNIFRVGPWQGDSEEIGYILELGEQSSSADLFIELLENYRILIYNGQFDMDCNFIGTEAWLSQLKWSAQKEFNALPRKPWAVGPNIGGSVRTYQNLTQLVVYGAGHLVPMNQPESALSFFNTFVHGGGF